MDQLEDRLMLVFQQADVNKDGLISYDEFLRVMTGFDYYLNLNEKEIIEINNSDHDYCNTDCNNSYHPFDSNEDDNDDAINETCGKIIIFITYYYYYYYYYYNMITILL